MPFLHYNKYAMKVYIVNSEICGKAKEYLESQGRVVLVTANHNLPEQEKHHADMQFAKISHNTIVAAPGIDSQIIKEIKSCGINVITGKCAVTSSYPGNIPYNILYAGKYFFHNTKYTDTAAAAAIAEKGTSIYHINQGYAGCSSIAVSSSGKTLILTSDNGLITEVKKLRNTEIKAEYFADTKKIYLKGYDHGFIGGSCGFDSKKRELLIYGKINEQLKELSEQYNFKITSIYNGPITDIGGILIMYPDQQGPN